MRDPKVSVVMPVYNGEKYLKKTIQSILNQTYRNFELIVINDGSTDNSVKILKKIKDSRIKILTNKKNIGLPLSLNKGIIHATGKYIARADSDDIYASNRLKDQVSFLEKNKKYILVGCNADLINEQNKIIGEEIYPTEDKQLRRTILIRNVLIHPSVLMKTEAVKRVGQYKRIFTFGAEEYDLWFRLMSVGKVKNLSKRYLKRRIYKEAYSQKNHLRVEFFALFVRCYNFPRYIYNLFKFI